MTDKKYHRQVYILLCTLVTGLCLDWGYTQTSEHYSMHRSVIAQGGAASSSSDFLLQDCVGQPSPPGFSSSENYWMLAGFWEDETRGTDVYDDSGVNIPAEIYLMQNYPNPFNNETTIEYQLAKDGPVDIRIYDLYGGEVKVLLAEDKKTGYHEVSWDGTNQLGLPLPSAMYICKGQIGDQWFTRKVIILK